MEEEGGGIRLSKRFNDKEGEVDNKTKSGTAWSHNFLNQKPWHPLSYPNQRRKWIAEQTNAQHQRRADEVAREFAQEQEFFRQTALVSKKEKEKVEMMRAVSFMYVRPPGYDPESAKAAEIAENIKNDPYHDQDCEGPSNSVPPESSNHEEKKKSRPKDVFGRSLPTGEEFDVLKNAPKLETGIAGRPKPFGIEVRNVKCLRCGTYGHQSGDRECLMKDIITPNEESRLKRDDPLTAIIAHMDGNEPLKWELKQKPGISPPRGGFKQDDPNQQIVAEDIFDEYGGFLSGGIIPKLLTEFRSIKPKKKKSKRKSKQKKQPSPISKENEASSDDDDKERRAKRKEKKHKTKKRNHRYESEIDSPHKKRKRKHSHSSKNTDYDDRYRSKHHNRDYDHGRDWDQDQHHRRSHRS